MLVFVAKESDKRKKIIKQLLSACKVISAQTPKESEWPIWIQWMGNKYGLTFSPPALELLKNQSGYHLINIKNEIKKLSHFLVNKKQVSAEDILKLVPRTRPENIFALSHAIGNKHLSSALLCWTKLLEDNRNALSALALITRHMRILIRVQEGLKRGDTKRELCQKAGVPVFVLQNYINEAKLWRANQILFVMELLLKTDRAIKTSGSVDIWMENCIIKACL